MLAIMSDVAKTIDAIREQITLLYFQITHMMCSLNRISNNLNKWYSSVVRFSVQYLKREYDNLLLSIISSNSQLL